MSAQRWVHSLAGLSDQKWSAQRSGQSSPASAADQLVSKRLWKPDVSLLVTCPPPTQPPRLKPSSLVPRALAHKTRLFPTFLSRTSLCHVTKSQKSKQLLPAPSWYDFHQSRHHYAHGPGSPLQRLLQVFVEQTVKILNPSILNTGP